MTVEEAEPVRVLRVIGRLNVGGPAIQAITLTARLEPRGYATLLVRGVEGDREGSMDHLADALGVRPRRVAWLRRSVGRHDIRALIEVWRIVRTTRPDILHTHAAKGGAIGRTAAIIAGRRRPRVILHTFHGHVLTDYFSPGLATLFRRVERFLAARSTVLIAVSSEVRDDLVRLGIAPHDKVRVVPLGFDLEPFVADGGRGDAERLRVRRELAIAPAARVVTLVARLAPIKRVDRFLAVAEQLADLPGVRFVVVGDGELRDELRASSAARRLADRVVWAGLRHDMPGVCFASDVVVLTSDNEGTPVSLIEAQAAGVPVVSTRVGGVESVVLDGVSGSVVDRDDVAGFAGRVRALLEDRELAAVQGSAGRSHVLSRFGLDRLVDDVDGLYRELLDATE
jgi:glycosyltransferase involved in cell wall biosynthesis